MFPSVPKLGEAAKLTHRRYWLGGLDSNQDTQIQSLMSYRLDDLPAEGGTKRNRSRSRGAGSHDSLP